MGLGLGRLAPRIAALSGWRLNLVASSLAFATYFCMYAFRKPFAAATYGGPGWLGLDLKTLFVISQVLGYTVSKYIGIKWVSEISRKRRLSSADASSSASAST